MLVSGTPPGDSPSEYDLFISHASADKDDFVRPLVKALEARGYRVWFDEDRLVIGDSLRKSIDIGLSRAKRGLVILSPAFLGRNWPEWELSGLVQRQNSEGETLIVPIWHDLSHKEIVKYSPSLADLVAIPSSAGVDAIVRKLARFIPPRLNGPAEVLQRARDLGDEAKIMRKCGKLPEAEELFLRALDLKKASAGENSGEYATTLAGLGGLYQAMQRYEDADRAYSRAIGIRRKTLPFKAEQLAVSLSSYALVRNKMGGNGPREAEALYDEAIRLKTGVFGADSVQVAATERRAAEIFRPHGWLTKASALAEHALSVQECVLGPGKQLARTLRILAKIRADQGEIEEAILFAERALEMRGQTDPPDDEEDEVSG